VPWKSAGGNTGHGKFVQELQAKAQAHNGLDLGQHGHFQERLDIFNSMIMQPDSLETGFYCGGKFANASEFVAIKGLPYVCCNTCRSSLIPKEKLMKCSRCKCVWYCSRQHQLDDWPKHKKICASLAAYRKDKEKMKQVVETSAA
jgi:MYND finger